MTGWPPLWRPSTHLSWDLPSGPLSILLLLAPHAMNSSAGSPLPGHAALQGACPVPTPQYVQFPPTNQGRYSSATVQETWAAAIQALVRSPSRYSFPEHFVPHQYVWLDSPAPACGWVEPQPSVSQFKPPPAHYCAVLHVWPKTQFRMGMKALPLAGGQGCSTAIIVLS